MIKYKLIALNLVCSYGWIAHHTSCDVVHQQLRLCELTICSVLSYPTSSLTLPPFSPSSLTPLTLLPILPPSFPLPQVPTQCSTVHLFHYTGWPENCSPMSNVSIIKMNKAVLKAQMQTGNKCTTVVCK